MNERKKYLLIFIIGLFCLTYIGYYFIMGGNVEVIDRGSHNGYIDLSGFSEEEETVRLSGEWLYYDRTLYKDIAGEKPEVVTIPERNSLDPSVDYFRYGTYVLNIDGLKPNTVYGIYSGYQVTAYNLYINGIKTLSNGRVGTSEEGHTSEWVDKIATVTADENGYIQMAYEISNYTYLDGLFWIAPEIGDSSNITSSYLGKILSDGILTALFLMLSIGMIVVYFYSKKYKIFLFLGLVVLDMCVRTTVTSSKILSQLSSYSNWNLVEKLEYLTGYLLLPLLLLLFAELFGLKKRILFQKIAYTLIVLTVAFVTLTPVKIFMIPLDFYMIIMGIIIVIFIGYLIARVNNSLVERLILLLVFVNFMFALIMQYINIKVSYVPIALLNSFIAIMVIVLNRYMIEVKAKELRLLNAMIDPLTGLYNRYYLENLKGQYGEKFDYDYMYVLFIDLDGFKTVNDQYGHEEGDEILQIVGQRLRNCVRSEDVLIRYGGDEFVILASGKKEKEVIHMCRRIVEHVSQIIVNNEHIHAIGASIGVSTCCDFSSEGIEAAIKKSDEAMYKVKSHGGNDYFHIEKCCEIDEA